MVKVGFLGFRVRVWAPNPKLGPKPYTGGEVVRTVTIASHRLEYKYQLGGEISTNKNTSVAWSKLQSVFSVPLQ